MTCTVGLFGFEVGVHQLRKHEQLELLFALDLGVAKLELDLAALFD